MNERIQELKDKAWATCEEPEQYMDKFAELLIKECTNMLPEDSVRDSNGVHMFYVIRKHFGVSEIGR